EMHLRGKPGRTLLTVALSGIAMTDRAILGENLLARRHVLARIGVAKQRHDIVGDLLDFGRLQDAVGAEARHLRLARVGVAAADAMRDGLLDRIERAAPGSSTRSPAGA